MNAIVVIWHALFAVCVIKSLIRYVTRNRIAKNVTGSKEKSEAIKLPSKIEMLFSLSLSHQQKMSFTQGTPVLLKTDVKDGRVGDECTVVSSNNGWIKVALVGMDYSFNVRASQIEVKPPVQLSMFDRWNIGV